jgi:hypothetical protein
MHPGHFASRDRVHHGIVKRAVGVALAAALVCAWGQSGAGHSVGHYPSYYPDEIRIDAVDPAAAGKGLVDETLHAYVGAMPNFAGPIPGHVKSAKSLGSFLVLSLSTTSALFASPQDRCAAARRIMAALGEEKADGFIFLPYPVTPYHADYLHHLDRIEAAKAVSGGASLAAAVKVGAKGRLAERVVRARWGVLATGADAVLEVVTVDDLLAAAGVQFLGWSGPPWVKEGWFQAHRLLASGLDAASRLAVDGYFDLLIRGEIRGLAERTDLERHLVAALTKGCERLVVGYALKEEFFNEAYPAGVENVAYDSMSGLNSPIFIRTVKLKDYPWNGKLRLGVRNRSDAAWNPVGGFTDVMGRLIWSAVGDPAMIPFPDNASWMPNRVQSEATKVVGQSGGVKVPADAMCPVPGSGALQRVADRTVSSAKVVYDVLASPFGDGTEMAVADLLYPYAFAYRWGAGTGQGGNTHEPRLEAAYAALQERLVGLKVVRVDKTTHAIAEGLNVVVTTPVLEVYLKDAPGDDRQLAALAPPWSTVPWHLLVLMEEAVERSYAAFSKEEATRRRVPWLDLVRDPTLRTKLQGLMAKFEREGYRPEPLKNFVSADEAQARWRALRAFSEKNGHVLVTNGPYRLKEWSPQIVVLDAVRDITYPLGFGTFDRFVNPPRAVIEAVAQDAVEITVRADAEMILKAGRQYQARKEPLLRTTARGVDSLLVVTRYVLIGPDGKVLKVDKMQWREDGLFSIRLPESLPPGRYTVFFGIFLDGNSLQPPTRILHFSVGAARSPD